MAIALTPVMARRYNHNPRGSATTTVVMKANNPWERKSQLMNAPLAGIQPGGALPGMGGLGDDPLPTTNATPLTAQGSSALSSALAAGMQLAAARIQTLYGSGASALPIVNPNAPKPVPAPAPSSSAMPLILGIGGLGLVAYLFLRKK